MKRLLLLAILAFGCQTIDKPRAKAHHESADRLYDEGQLKSAIKEYGLAVKYDSENYDYRISLIKAYLLQGQFYMTKEITWGKAGHSFMEARGQALQGSKIKRTAEILRLQGEASVGAGYAYRAEYLIVDGCVDLRQAYNDGDHEAEDIWNRHCSGR